MEMKDRRMKTFTGFSASDEDFKVTDIHFLKSLRWEMGFTQNVHFVTPEVSASATVFEMLYMKTGGVLCHQRFQSKCENYVKDPSDMYVNIMCILP